MNRSLHLLALLLVISGNISPAHAEPDANSEALAESLYREGKRLMAEGEAQQACPKFAESYRLSPATGTQLNLAACYQEAGKWASAWTAYQAAVAAAARDGRQDRVTYAQEKIAEIEPMLSYVTVSTSEGERPPGLEVSIDGAKISAQALGIPLPIDPGPHEVTALAPGFESWSGQLAVEEEKARLTLVIPPLTPLPAPEQTAPVEDDNGAPLAPASATITEQDTGIYRPIPTSVYVAAGLTAAAGAGALVTGILYFPQRTQAQESDDATDSAKHTNTAESLSAANTGLLIATGVGAAATTLLYLMRPAAKTPAQAVADAGRTPWLLPWATEQGGGLLFTAHGDLGSGSNWSLH